MEGLECQNNHIYHCNVQGSMRIGQKTTGHDLAQAHERIMSKKGPLSSGSRCHCLAQW